MTRDRFKPPPPPQRLEISGLRVRITGGEVEPPAPAEPLPFVTPEAISLEPMAGRDLEFEAECAREQELDDLADWESAQPKTNVVGFDALKRLRK